MTPPRRLAPTPVDFVPTDDVLLRHASLEHAVELPVLGIPTRFETNSRYVAGVVEESFGAWRAAPAGTTEALDPAGVMRVRVVIHAGSEGADAEHAPVRHIAAGGSRIIVHSPGSVAVSDPSRREAVAYVTAALAADRAHFRGAVLETITLSLLAHFDRHPLHAAAVGRGGRVVLLAGPSGAGKSTLAYAAHSAGLDVLSEDTVWVQLAPALRIWGWPGGVRLLPHAPALFPEVATTGALSTADGKRKLAVPLNAPGGASRHAARSASVCILQPGRAREPALERISASAVAEPLRRDVAPGFDRYPERHAQVVQTLTAGGGWRLTLSNDPRQAVALVERMLEEALRH